MKIKQVHFIRNSISNIQNFEIDINNLIQAGWQPLGETKVVKHDGQDVVIQQMILTEE